MPYAPRASFAARQTVPAAPIGPAPRKSEITIVAVAQSDEEHSRNYKGRYVRWPGILLLVGIVLVSIGLVVWQTINTHDTTTIRSNKQLERRRRDRRIGRDGDGGLFIDTDGDGEVGNPKQYKDEHCKLPNYTSRDGKIFAEMDGKSVRLAIKGINWFGMETPSAIPFGLWDNNRNGTTVYEIATFLAKNKFNSVRLPLSVESIVKNIKPNKSFINQQTNRAIGVNSYLALIKSLVRALAYRKISVLLDLHVLSSTDKGKLWHSPQVPKSMVLKSVDILTKNLCRDLYWNIIGLDLKNEPYECTWGDGNVDRDFRLGAEQIGNRMLKGCSKWLAFVEGVNANHKVTIDGETFSYYDWWGGGLQRAGESPPRLSHKDKIVWAPHYYTPSVFPSLYMYAGGKRSGQTLDSFTELPTDVLNRRIDGTMEDMFGYLRKKAGSAIVLGEFGGIYMGDRHPQKTNRRATDHTIANLKMDGYAGGYIWSLNPESGYEFNPADTFGHFQEGLLTSTWLGVNEPYLKTMKQLDNMSGLAQFPCFT